MYQKVTVIGVIDEEPKVQGKFQDFTIHVESVGGQAVDTRITINTKQYPQYSYGDRLSLTGKLILPRNFAGDDGRVFDYIHFLEKDGIYFIMKSPVALVLSTGNGEFVHRLLFSFKRIFLEHIKNVLGEPQASLAAGLVVGEKSALGASLIDDFRKSGLIHIVILSGYSISLVAGSIRKIFSFLPRRLGLCAAGVSIILFGILVGGSATVVRACIMALVGVSAEIFYKDYSALRALFFAAYIMILQNPHIVLHDPSFQVSCTATFGLIILSKPLQEKLSFITERFEIRGLVVSTLATQISVLPLMLYLMGQISLVGVIVNILVLPFIPVTMLAVFATGFLGFISYYCSLALAFFAHVLLGYELFMVGFFAHLPFASLNIEYFPLWMMWGMYFCYAVAFIWLQKKNSFQSPPS